MVDTLLDYSCYEKCECAFYSFMLILRYAAENCEKDLLSAIFASFVKYRANYIVASNIAFSVLVYLYFEIQDNTELTFTDTKPQLDSTQKEKLSSFLKEQKLSTKVAFNITTFLNYYGLDSKGLFVFDRLFNNKLVFTYQNHWTERLLDSTNFAKIIFTIYIYISIW